MGLRPWPSPSTFCPKYEGDLPGYTASMSCLCNRYNYYLWRSYLFETQRASYTCGPIAIINALRYQRRIHGAARAVHRQVMVHCRPRPVHPDGFKGTQIADMDAALRRYWPAARRVTGDGVRDALRAPMSILLFRRNRHILHYVFVHYDGLRYHLENEANIGSQTELSMKQYLRDAVVWVLVS